MKAITGFSKTVPKRWQKWSRPQPTRMGQESSRRLTSEQSILRLRARQSRVAYMGRPALGGLSTLQSSTRDPPTSIAPNRE